MNLGETFKIINGADIGIDVVTRASWNDETEISNIPLRPGRSSVIRYVPGLEIEIHVDVFART